MWRRYSSVDFGILDLAKDVGTDVWAKPLRRECFYFTTEQVLQEKTELHEVIERFFSRIKLNQQVHVAVVAGFVADEGAEDAIAADTVGFETQMVGAESLQQVLFVGDRSS